MKIIEKVIPESSVIYKPSAPFKAKVVENRRLIPEGEETDIRHIVLDLSNSQISYLEGQSLGVIPPGTQENGKSHKPRLYTISSARKGEDGFESTVSLTVKRVQTQLETGESFYGLASNYVCDLKPGDEVLITGPNGRKFLLPADSSVNLIMIAVGTGIAPFRAFIKHIYTDRKEWKGKIRLFYGSKTGMEALYMNDKNNDIGQYFEEDTFRAFNALSQEQKTESGERMYVQHRLEENQDELWGMIKEGNFCFYLCGLKGLEQGVEDRFAEWAKKDNLDWESMKKQFKEEGRWNIEVY